MFSSHNPWVNPAFLGLLQESRDGGGITSPEGTGRGALLVVSRPHSGPLSPLSTGGPAPSFARGLEAQGGNVHVQVKRKAGSSEALQGGALHLAAPQGGPLPSQRLFPRSSRCYGLRSLSDALAMAGGEWAGVPESLWVPLALGGEDKDVRGVWALSILWHLILVNPRCYLRLSPFRFYILLPFWLFSLNLINGLQFP